MAEYLKNKDLLAEVLKCQKNGELSVELKEMFMLMLKKIISQKFYSVDKYDRDEYFQEGYLRLDRYWNSFDIEKGNNAFTYYTEIIKRSCALTFKKLHATKGEPNAILISLDNLYDEHGFIFL